MLPRRFDSSYFTTTVNFLLHAATVRARVSQAKINAVKHSAVDQGSGECKSFKEKRLFAGRWCVTILLFLSALVVLGSRYYYYF